MVAEAEEGKVIQGVVVRNAKVASGGGLVEGPAEIVFTFYSDTEGRAYLEFEHFYKQTCPYYDYASYLGFAVNGQGLKLSTSTVDIKAEVEILDLSSRDSHSVYGLKRKSAWLHPIKIKKGANVLKLKIPQRMSLDRVWLRPQLEGEWEFGEATSDQPANIFYRDETVELSVRVANTGNERMKIAGEVLILAVRQVGKALMKPSLFWQTHIAHRRAVKLSLAGGEQGMITVRFRPEENLCGAVCLRLRNRKKVLYHRAGYVVVVPRLPEELDEYGNWMTDMLFEEEEFAVAHRLGFKWTRRESGWREPKRGSPDWKHYDRYYRLCRKYKILPMVSTQHAHSNSWAISSEGVSSFQAYFNTTPLPKYFPEAREFWRSHHERYKDIVRAYSVGNENWEGGGISGWRANGAHFRQYYSACAEGTESAEPGIPWVVADSAHNADWKLVSAVERLGLVPWWKHISNHYLVPEANYGPALARLTGGEAWDTESWMGGFADFAVLQRSVDLLSTGTRKVNDFHIRSLLRGRQPTPIAAMVGVRSYFLPDLIYEKEVNPNRLPFIFVFRNRPNRAEKCVAVVIGSIGARRGWDGAMPEWRRVELPADRRGQPFGMTGEGYFVLRSDGVSAFDLLGNRICAKRGFLRIPLGPQCVYITTRLTPAEFEEILSSGRVEGVMPARIQVFDITTPLREGAVLRVRLQNVYNEKQSGTVYVRAPSLGIECEAKEFADLPPGEWKEMEFETHIGGELKPSPLNRYDVEIIVETARGWCGWREWVSEAFVARGRPTIDGEVSEWEKLGSVPVFLAGQEVDFSALRAQRPWQKFPPTAPDYFVRASALYDDEYFYFVAEVKDATENRIDSLLSGVDHNVYQPPPFDYIYKSKGPELGDGDCLQLAFNCSLETKQKKKYNYLPAGHPESYRHPVLFADYGYAIYPVKDGRAELFRYLREDFYYIYPYPPAYGWWSRHCRVEGAKVVVKRKESGWIYEVAIPWAEMPEAMPAGGRKVKFSFLLKDNGRPSACWSAWRSVARRSSMDFEPRWQYSWSCQTEWGWGR